MFITLEVVPLQAEEDGLPDPGVLASAPLPACNSFMRVAL
jgi:hypothetical protein